MERVVLEHGFDEEIGFTNFWRSVRRLVQRASFCCCVFCIAEIDEPASSFFSSATVV